MLSYQHEYHCGNTADILKHTALCLILDSLCKKDKPFTIIDSHSGAGRFSLEDERILKTGEGKEGIEKLQEALSGKKDIPYGVNLYMEKEAPYLKEKLYAGSPELERLFLRKGDQLHLNDLHPQVFESLKKNMSLPLIDEEKVFNCPGKVNLHNEDSYKNLVSLTPPLIKRGLVLCDPSFEDQEDYKKVRESLMTVHKKWNTAIIALWYPLLARRKNDTAQMLTALEDFGKLGTNPADSFKMELIVKNPDELQEEEGPHMYGSGIFIMNPPWMLKENLQAALDFYSSIFTQS
ncbi:23S rRNA (adenine(2030)-N(6))-methyltransferase RlmJ [Treponema sp.]|uniref:23S rRNA (adenine(2030)-N(6))-methyltransferase RlmJ n=1 Tax=Treponema sp. TaxID=166 RepID=UPI0025F04AFC|nr:23S rRNA (adenine(2030)-N(6))-methyltransferase RlmJ [Treponema sp.]MCR5218816.1 23S rRNA (adenine(2030)-N(6))-methyltransferase RlmJ [Treponema sp.]